MKTERIQRFQVLDFVYDSRGIFVPASVRLMVTEVFTDPHDKNFSHCSGTSAKYRVVKPNGEHLFVWDWHLSNEPNQKPQL